MSTEAMTEEEWTTFLRKWSQEAIASAVADEYTYDPDLPDKVVASGWLGSPGATEEELSALEARLGMRLPPSYRQFLKVTNGWRATTSFIDKMLPTQEVAWLKDYDRQWIDIWFEIEEENKDGSDQLEENIKDDFVSGEHLKAALAVSEGAEYAILLLNPKVVTAEGEWEAWHFTYEPDEFARYPSFERMMLALYEQEKELKEAREQRPSPPSPPWIARGGIRGWMARLRMAFLRRLVRLMLAPLTWGNPQAREILRQIDSRPRSDQDTPTP